MSVLYPHRLSGQEIRLLELYHGSGSDTIKTRLIPANLSADLDFEAISYVWGDKTVKCPISCNGVEIGITQNLYEALVNLRLPHRSRLVWADAICINQHDIEERNQQVSVMHQVFSQASMVAIWLGRDTGENLHLAVAAINLIYQRCAEYAAARNLNLTQLGWAHSESVTVVEDTSLDDSFDSKTWQSLSCFFSRPWFERVWCVQEILLAKQGVILTDMHQIPWDRVGISAAVLISQISCPNDYRSDPRQRDKAISCTSALQLHFHTKKATLLEDLETFRHLKATDPRDQVYGLLGLQNDLTGGHRLEADYGKTTAQVYTDVVIKAASDDDGLGFLSCVQHKDSFQQLTDFPSWVPDWPSGRWVSHLNRGSWYAGGQQATNVSFPSHREMLTQGIFFEKISFVSDIHPLGPNKYGSLHPFPDQIYEIWRSYVSMNPQIETFQCKFEALARILTAGYTVNGEPVYQLDGHQKSSFYADCFAFIKHIHQYMGHRKQILEPPCLTGFEGNWKRYAHGVRYACRGRRFFRTTGGAFGLGPASASIGDVVCVLQGGKVPYVLRADGDSFHFLGECYVDEIMRGELFQRDTLPHSKLTMLSLK